MHCNKKQKGFSDNYAIQMVLKPAAEALGAPDWPYGNRQMIHIVR
jgi:hypothetical protein